MTIAMLVFPGSEANTMRALEQFEALNQFRVVFSTASREGEDERDNPRAGDQSNQRVKKRIHEL